jgi:hypothetical protein
MRLALVLLLASGCGISARAFAGPTFSSEHRAGLELGADVGVTLDRRDVAAQVGGVTLVTNILPRGPRR